MNQASSSLKMSVFAKMLSALVNANHLKVVDINQKVQEYVKKNNLSAVESEHLAFSFGDAGLDELNFLRSLEVLGFTNMRLDIRMHYQTAPGHLAFLPIQVELPESYI